MDKYKKILIVSQYYWPETFRINDLADALIEKGHQVDVLTALPNYPEGKFYKNYSLRGPYSESHAGARIYRVPIISRGTKKSYRLLINYLSYVISATIGGLWHLRDKYDLIFVYEPSPITVALPAIVLKYLFKCPMFFWVTDLWPETLVATGVVKSPFILNQVGRLVKFLYKHSDLVFVSADSFGKNLLRYGAIEKKIFFPYWADKIFEVQTLSYKKTKSSLVPEGFVVMFAGNIGTSQCFETIVDAADALRDQTHIKWVIVGDGLLRSWVDSEILRRNLNQTFFCIGKHPVEKMPELFSAANAMLVSLKDEPVFELTVPSKIQTYMASARPVIAMLKGEGAEIIQKAHCGVTCSPGNKNSLVDAVLTLSSLSDDEREKMGRNGLDYYNQNFSREKAVNNLLQTLTNFQLGTK